MKRTVRRALSALLSVVMLLGLLVVPAGAVGEAAHTVWLVGDSTVCAFTDAYYYPRYGYGTQIGNYLDGTYEVKNLALSGRSSKSFLGEANYTTLKNGIQPGDALIIGFGHNDEKAEADRYTDPNGDWQTAGSFAESLYTNYVKLAQDKGAEAILCTPIVRRNKESDTLSNANCHITTDATVGGKQYPGGDYPGAIRQLGAAKNVTVVDLTALTKELYEDVGTAGTVKFHAQTLSPKEDGTPRGVDDTHLNIYGAKKVAWMFANALKDVSTSELGKHVDLAAGEPTETELISNPGYKEPEYTPPADDVVSFYEDYQAGGIAFKGTAFGQLGGGFTKTNYTLETDASGNAHIAVVNTKSKISSTEDGVAMYYYKVPVGSQIEFSARAKINGFTDDNNKSQAAFGLMARDDMYINAQVASLATDYVAAGSFATGGNCFYRKDATRHVGPALKKETIAVGQSYDLKIVSNTDGYACTFGREDTQTGGFDFQLTAVDGDHFYVGMFCSRSFDVTFSNIILKVDGVELCNTTPDFAFDVTGWKFVDDKGAASDEAVDGGKLSAITATLDGGDENAMAMVAVYDTDNKLTGVKVVTPAAGDIAVDLAMNGGETAKVITFDKTTLIPYGPAASVTSGEAGGGGDTPDPGPGPDDPGPDDPVTGKRIQVWDIAGKQETNADLYVNHITPKSWAGKGVTGGAMPAENTDITFGDLTLNSEKATDKLLSNVTSSDWGATLTAGSNSWIHDFNDGYISAGGFVGNGTGTGTRRYITIANVKAGDTVVAYVSNNGSGAGDILLEGQGDAAADCKTSAVVNPKAFVKVALVATADGTYKLWDNNKIKPVFLRVMVVPPVTVSGDIALPSDFNATGWGLKFVDPVTKAETVATVDKAAKTYTAELAPGHTYNASLTGVTDWGTTTATKQVTPVNADVPTGKTHDLTVEAKSNYTYSGTITGFASGYDVSKLVITMVADETSKLTAGAEDVDLTITGANFTAQLAPGVVYTPKLTGVNDYQVKSPATVTSESNLTGQTIEVELKTTYAASGSFVVLDPDDHFAPLYEGSEYAALSAEVTALTFKNVEDNYTYTATPNAGGYSINLRPGAYEVQATATGYATKTHVVVEDKAVTKDLLFNATAAPESDPVSYAADIYVGYAGDETKTPNFKTVTGALTYIKRMTDRNDRRVTVHIAPGTYREQINVDSKNVTFVNDDPSKEVKLTWYYGIGYTYYSATGKSGTDSWYDPELAFDKYTKPTIDVARWGATVRLTASGFQAEGITFENSLNRELTEEELLDGVEPTGSKPVREYGLDVTSKPATERGAAIWMDSSRGDKAEFKNCTFLSSQDTVGTGGRAYFKDCYIEGMTDYICGPGNVVFDTCQLNWKGYSDSTIGGYITAAQTAAGGKGYIFRNCYVSADSKLQVGAGGLGRTWGMQNTACIFLNTTLQSANVLSNNTWEYMNAGKDPNFTSLDQVPNIKEYGTTLTDGTAVNLSQRTHQPSVQGTAPTFVLADYFTDWTPEYYTPETAGTTVAFTADPVVSTNGDSNTPKYGNTLTVGYSLGAEADANDVSEIKWYRLGMTAEKTPNRSDRELILTTSANVSRSYKTVAADANHFIEAEVTPKTMGGKTGVAKSAQLQNAIVDDYNDPTVPAGKPDLGDGVNLFLAGDSTVKDYSAGGMYEGGTQEELGSWGEWFQAYFDKEQVTVANYANGGRSTRNFINEGSLKKIQDVIGEGDYLFIQFGHNDCSNDATSNGKDTDYIPTRYAPLGTPDASGKYPTELGAKVDTATAVGPAYASTYTDKWGSTCYAWYSGTYKGFLLEYVKVALEKGATPVLMTPVARMYYTSAGDIRPHHDSNYIPDQTADPKTWAANTDKNNAYCTAVEQLYNELKNGDYDSVVGAGKGAKVKFIDTFALTKTLFEDAWSADSKNSDAYGSQLMGEKAGGGADSTHCNKLGGLIEAALVAQAVQDMGLNISATVKAPAQIQAKTSDGKQVFTVNGSGDLTANDILTDYASPAAHWQTFGQTKFQAIAQKAAELAASAEK